MVDRIDRLRDGWKDLTLWKTVRDWAEVFGDLQKVVFHYTADPNNNNDEYKSTRNILSNAIPQLKTKDLATIYLDIDRARAALHQFAIGVPENISAGFGSEFYSALGAFGEALNKFLITHGHEEAAILLFASRRLIILQRSVISNLTFVRDNLAGERIAEPDADDLTLIYPQELTVPAVADILREVYELYAVPPVARLCNGCGIRGPRFVRFDGGRRNIYPGVDSTWSISAPGELSRGDE
jgi:hypothetical protein